MYRRRLWTAALSVTLMVMLAAPVGILQYGDDVHTDASGPVNVSDQATAGPREAREVSLRQVPNVMGTTPTRAPFQADEATGTRADPQSYVFYEDFETGSDGWTLQDLNPANGLDTWAATADRPCYGSSSLYCAGSGSQSTRNNTILRDTAEYPEQWAEWTSGDNNSAYGYDYWGRSSARASQGSYSYWCSEVSDHIVAYDYEASQNTTSVPIPDNGGGWVYSEIVIDDAPAGSVIAWVDVYVLASHTWVSDLTLDLEDENVTDAKYVTLWDQLGGETDQGNDDDAEDDWDIDMTVASINTFNGDPVNQVWRLYAVDNAGGDTGTIDDWWIKVYYTTAQHYDNRTAAYMKREVDLSGHTGCGLEFDYWLDTEDGWDFAYVKADVEDHDDPEHANWTTLATYSAGYDSHDVNDVWDGEWWNSGWLDLGAYDGGPVYLLFYFTSDERYFREGWYVDDITVKGWGHNYSDYQESSAVTSFDLAGYSNAYLAFNFWLDAEDGYDVLNVSMKNDTDGQWTDLAWMNTGSDEYQYDGQDPDLYARAWWYSGHIQIDGFCGNSVQLRFWFSSDEMVSREGAYIDEIVVASTFFYDEMESGDNGWTTTSSTQPNWHRVTTDAYSPTTSWWCGKDSTSLYGGGMDEYLVHDFDLTFAKNATLEFSFTGQAEDGYDFLYVGISIDGGSNWDYYGGFTGTYSGWWVAEIDLSSYVKHQAQVAFDFYSDKIVNQSGFWIDDVCVFGTVDLEPPAQVQNLVVTPTVDGGGLDLLWDANSEPDLAGYYVYRSETGGGPYSLIDASATNSYSDTGLTVNVTYYYVVSAYDAGGNEGSQSAEASGKTQDDLPPAPLLVVNAADTGMGGEVNVTWQLGLEPDIAGYKVYYNTTNFSHTSGGVYYPSSPVDDSYAAYCVIGSLDNGIEYHFAVTAIDKSGNENYTIQKTATAIPTDTTPPNVTITNPPDSALVTGVVQVLVAVADNSNVTGVNISIDKGPGNPCVYDNFLRRWVWDWDTSGESDGSHTIDAQAFDEWGNPGDAPQVTVTKQVTKVCIDPGHGGTEPGATGVDGAGYPDEKDVTLAIGLEVQSLLALYGFDVYMTRTTDVTVSLADRCAIANDNATDIFVSVHANSLGDDTVQGTETFYWGDGPTYSVNGQRLAGHVQLELVNSTARPDRGIHADFDWLGYHLYVLANTAMPAALTEVAFMSNQTEFDMLAATSFQIEAAQGIFNGIRLYFGYEAVDFAPPDVDTLTAADADDHLGGAIELDWSGYYAPPDFQRYRIYRSTSPFTLVTDPGVVLIDSAIVDPETRSFTDSTTTDGVDYYYAVCAVDAQNNVDDEPVVFGPVQSVGKWNALDTGWNLISLPKVQPDESISTVLASIAGKYDAVQWYDAATGEWRCWQKEKFDTGNDELNDLQYLNHTMGIYINVTQACVFAPSGTDPTDANNNILLHPGWNLVGFPCTSPTLLAQTALAGVTYSVVQYFNATTQSFVNLVPAVDLMKAGVGYWIYCDTAGTQVWDVS